MIRATAAFVILIATALQAHAGHPLITEDTDVLGKGRWQLQLQAERLRNATEIEPEIAYGIGERVDLELAIPYQRERTHGELERGWGDASLTLKWRFFEREQLALVLKPVLSESGWEANIVAGYTAGRLEALAQLGYGRERDRPEGAESVRHRSIALLWSATQKASLMIDLVSRTPAREVVYGLLYDVTDDLDVGIGIKRGLNDAAEDRALLFGVRLSW